MLIAFVVSSLLSLVLCSIIRWLANRNGWLFSATSDRHIHKRAVPRLGGIAVFLSFCVTLMVMGVLRPELLWQSHVLRLVLPAALLFGVGVYDDFKPVSAKVKFGFQIAAGLSLFQWTKLTPIGQELLRYELGLPILIIGTVAWVVIVTNSINLIDGVDGLAAGTAALSLAAAFCIAMKSGEQQIALFTIILVGATLGFLRFNFSPATLFLGDGGSLFLGFMIAATGIGCNHSGVLTSTVSVAVAVVALPLAETSVSVIRRFLSGRPIFTPDREHMHHKLLDRGFSQRHVVWVLYAVAALCGLSGITIALGGAHVLLSAMLFAVVLSSGVVTLGYVEFREIGRILLRIVQQRKIVANNVEIRKLGQKMHRVQCLGEVTEELKAAFARLEFDGFEILTNGKVACLPECNVRSFASHWGYTVSSWTNDPACWTMSIDLVDSNGEKLGYIRLARRVERGTLLFDPNVLLTDLIPEVVQALEYCEHRCPTAEAQRIAMEDAVLVSVPMSQKAVKYPGRPNHLPPNSPVN